MNELTVLRDAYAQIKSALPLLDCYISDWAPVYEGAPLLPPTDFVKLDFTSSNPRLVRQTEQSFEEIAEMARKEPKVNFIIASGEKKLMYHITPIEEILKQCDNVYLCTANFCNCYGLERFVEKGLAKKLLYGTMMPFLDAGQALGPLVFARLDWKTKCDIAGNNFRALLGQKPIYTDEVKIPYIAPFIIDSHAHTCQIEEMKAFKTQPAQPDWKVWREVLNSFWYTDAFITPEETIQQGPKYPSYVQMHDLTKDSHGRMHYYEGFDPRDVKASIRHLETSLRDPLCVGIKIHPKEHQVSAADPRYIEAFAIAQRFNKPIMSHTWGVSDYNPKQKFATPAQFDAHLNAFPDVRLIFGHSGGRINGYQEAVQMCRAHHNACVDLAGDLYHNGYLAHCIREIGVGRMLFASDLYWFDARPMIGMLLETDLGDCALMQIFRYNAQRIFKL